MSSVPPNVPGGDSRVTRQKMRSASRRSHPPADTAKHAEKIAGREAAPLDESNYLPYQVNNLDNPEWRAQQAALKHRRRAREKQGGDKLTGAEWLALCESTGNRCLRCGSDGPLTIDHVVPLSKGGTNHISNCQPLCRSCNAHKHTQSTDFRR